MPRPSSILKKCSSSTTKIIFILLLAIILSSIIFFFSTSVTDFHTTSVLFSSSSSETLQNKKSTTQIFVKDEDDGDAGSETRNNNKRQFTPTAQDYHFCSSDPIHNCYSPKCYLPISISSNNNNINNNEHDWLLQSSEQRFSMKTFPNVNSYPLLSFGENHSSSSSSSPFKFGKGCVPNKKHFFPPKAEINQDGEHIYESEEMKEWSRGKKNQEFTCQQRRSDRTEYFKTKVEENRKNDALFKFKKHTSWMFSKWYDWKGNCVVPPEPRPPSSSPTTTENINKNDNVRNSSFNETSSSSVLPSRNADDDDANFILSGRHSPKDSLYRLKNVCLRPRGGFGGYFPEPLSKIDERIENYRGTQDITMVPYIAGKHPNPLRDWLHRKEDWTTSKSKNKKKIKKVPHRFRLAKPAKCYLDTKVMLMSIDSENPGHAFYRTGYTLRSIEAAFGRDAMLRRKSENENNQDNNVTIAFVVTDKERGLIKNFENNMKLNKMHFFYDTLGTSWFSTIGFRNDEFVATKHDLEELLGFKIDNVDKDLDVSRISDAGSRELTIEDEDSNIVCFKEIVISQGGYLADNKRSYGLSKENSTIYADEFTPGAQTVFHLHGKRTQRDTETLEIFDSLLRECALNKLPPRRRHARPRHQTHVVFGVRSYRRRMTLQPYLISYISQRLRGVFGNESTFEVLEHSTLSFSEVIERYTNADVFIALYGAALMWTLFMPPNSVVIEINSIINNYAKISGIDRNELSEYGGQAVMANLHHLVGSDRAKIVTRRPAMFNYDLHNGFAMMEGLLRSAACTLEFHHQYQHRQLLEHTSEESSLFSSCASSFQQQKSLSPGRKMNPKNARKQQELQSKSDLGKQNNNKEEITSTTTAAETLLENLRSCCELSEAQNDQLVLESSVHSPKWSSLYAPLILNTRLVPKMTTNSKSNGIHTNKNSNSNAKKYLPFLYSPRVEAMLMSKPSFSSESSSNDNDGSSSSTSSTIFAHFWTLINSLERPPKERAIKILFIEPCKTRVQILAEFSALRQTVFRSLDFSVVEYSLGKDVCNELYYNDEKMRRKRTRDDDNGEKNHDDDSDQDKLYRFLGNPSLTLEEASELWNADQARPLKVCQYPHIKNCLFGNVYMIDYVIHDCFLNTSSGSEDDTVHHHHCDILSASTNAVNDENKKEQELMTTKKMDSPSKLDVHKLLPSAHTIFETLAKARMDSIPDKMSTPLKMMSFGHHATLINYPKKENKKKMMMLFSSHLDQVIPDEKMILASKEAASTANNMTHSDETSSQSPSSSVLAGEKREISEKRHHQKAKIKKLEAGSHTEVWR